MRYESRAYGTREEIELVLKSAYEAPGRSERRQREAAEAGWAFLRGEIEIRLGPTLYIIEDDPLQDDTTLPGV